MSLILYENTFVSINDADNYFLNRPNSELWADLSDVQKEQSLIFASIKINNFDFIGLKKNPDQNLQFPRNFSPELPQDIKNAVCEEALAIIENSVHSQNKKLGISSISIGNSSVSYFDKDNIGILLSPIAFAFVSKWTVKNFNIS